MDGVEDTDATQDNPTGVQVGLEAGTSHRQILTSTSTLLHHTKAVQQGERHFLCEHCSK